ncbi:MAG: D-2-hydroxyacid dehydrogenase [Ardenticatenaceae bacterium]|nr:D-2-hydroxyacid dehydrogenase [Anaerolineales bacterium]MCB8985535.1 D-2-hydroxyacid dehydrogenase [Ardenticatenaceae bacterium]MCB8988807.1 D-2-hydroxyacid dehydrogenase [Ardenticatenaceae bacterium]
MTDILLTAVFPPNLLEKIRSASSDVTIEHLSLVNGRWPDEKTTGAEILYARGAVPRPELAPNLRWIQTHYAGVENLKDTAVWDSDILITTASGIHAPNMAQYALTQILVWANRVPTWFRQQASGKWPGNRWEKFLPDELRGQTLGIVGYGSIGRELARLAKALGMKVLATKRDARHPEDPGYTLPGTGDPTGTVVDRLYPSEATRSMISECDYVVNTLPFTEKTQHLFDEELFRAMKPTAFFINIGRGGTVNEKDLIRALKKGWLAGAGLDVFETEPLPETSPLWKMENVILTPHVSGFTPEYDERAIDLFAENLRRYLGGKPLLNVVNRETGY